MKKLVIVGISIIFILMILVVFIFRGNFNAFAIDEGNVREIVIDAKRFEYNPNVIKVKEGEIIRLKINNLEGEHGFSIPELGLEIHDKKGVKFVADKKGTFTFSCHHYCGSGHNAMKGVLIVE